MTDENIANDQAEKDAQNQLENLLAESEKINQELEQSSEETKKMLDAIDAGVDESVEKVEKLSAELDEIEKEAEDEMDQLILEKAEDLASEE